MQNGTHPPPGLSELDLERALSANLAGLRVPKLEELRPSRAFLAHLKVQAEEEAAALPGAAMPRWGRVRSCGLGWGKEQGMVWAERGLAVWDVAWAKGRGVPRCQGRPCLRGDGKSGVGRAGCQGE